MEKKDVRAAQKSRGMDEKARQALFAAHQVRVEVQSRFEEEVDSRFEEKEFSKTPTRTKFKELNMEMFEGTLEPTQKVREDADLAKRKIDEIVPVGSPTEIPKDQSHFGGFPRGRTQEWKEEMGDNMRCLYIH